ncbi:MAG: hypothetical protein WCS89_02095 [Candidatus Paceibacterota bacterium]|jgi:hypothetical protein
MKKCPFCKKEIHDKAIKCPYCLLSLVESIANNASNHFSAVKETVESDKFYKGYEAKIRLVKDYTAMATRFLKKAIFNKCVVVVAVIIFIAWAYSGDSDSNTGGTKMPLPQPTSLPSFITPIQHIDTTKIDQLGKEVECLHIDTPTDKLDPTTRAKCDAMKATQAKIKASCSAGGLISLFEPDYCTWLNKSDEVFNSTTTAHQQFLKDRQAGLTVPYSLDNGYVFKKVSSYLDGDGQLLIKNGTSHDAVAKLLRNGTSIFTVYVRAENTYTITNISDGKYLLAFMQGVDWDTVNKTFVKSANSQSFDDIFDITTTEDSQYVKYSKFTITLNPVIGGTAETSYMDPAQFNAY